MALETIELSPRVGSRILIDKATLLGGDHGREIRQILEQRGVVLFRGEDYEEFSDADLHALGGVLGTVRVDGKEGKERNTVMHVTLDKEYNSYAEFFRSTFDFHFDGTWEDVPPLASILTPRVVASEGGETEFINTYAAYEDLPDSEKRELEVLQVVHSMMATMMSTYVDTPAQPTEAELADWRNYGEKVHPMVWHHRSGRKSLALGNTVDRVAGMTAEESRALLQRVMAWCRRPQFTYAHKWRMGDVLIWDNTGTMHRARPYDVACGRRLHRITLVGEEPLVGVYESARPQPTACRTYDLIGRRGGSPRQQGLYRGSKPELGA